MLSRRQLAIWNCVGHFRFRSRSEHFIGSSIIILSSTDVDNNSFFGNRFDDKCRQLFEGRELTTRVDGNFYKPWEHGSNFACRL
jgi:hypothetical protein